MDCRWIILLVIGGGAIGALIAIATVVWWRIQTSEEKALARRVARLRFVHKLSLGVALFRDRRVSLITRMLALGLLLYLAMPLDFIPDFIPLIGILDDVLIVLIGGGLLLRSVPRYVIEEHVARYELRVGS
jgi:uncharacterized membrane protein YkvA (DUF1232 family)